MCFVKSSSVPKVVEQEPVVRQQADASLTKNSQNNQDKSGYMQNIRTSALGLVNEANTSKKTLLGE